MDSNIQKNNVIDERKVNITEVIQLYIQPINKDEERKISDVLFDGELFISKLGDINLNSLIVKKNSPIFNIIKKSSADKIDKLNLDDTNSASKFRNIKMDSDFKSNNILISKNICYAMVDGIFMMVNRTPQIIPILYDIPFKISVAKDSMIIKIDFFPPQENQNCPSLEVIIDEISKYGNVPNLDTQIIKDSILQVSQKQEALIDVCVAMGQYKIPGKKGWLENVVEKLQKEKEEKVEQEEKENLLTYHKNNSILSVGENQTIAIIHHAIEGEDGVDVFGKKLVCDSVKDVTVKLGKNVQYSLEDSSKICSKVDGFLELYENTFSVKETLDIMGNVDVNTRKIDSYGSLKVFGNVENEMTVKLSRNVEVQGYVGDATIEAGKDVTIKGGFLGCGNGVINALGNIELRFIENQKVFSRGSLTIKKESLNSELYVRNKIVSDRTHFAIIGGYAIATESIELYSAGNEYNTSTVLEVGYDYKKKLVMNKFSNKRAELKKELEVVDKEIIEISSMRRKSTQAVERIRFLANKHKEIFEVMESMKKKRQILFNEMNSPTSSKIVIYNTVYPGVKIIINGKQKLITERLRSKTFVLSKENEIVAI